MAHRIDTHPDRQKIVDALLSGESLRDIAKMAGISHQSVARYKRSVVPKAIKNARIILQNQPVPETSKEQIALHAEVTKAALIADPYVSAIASKRDRLTRCLAQAEQKEDFKSVAALDSADTRNLTLLAQLEGRLDSGNTRQPTTQVVVVMPIPQPAPREPGGPIIDVDPIV